MKKIILCCLSFIFVFSVFAMPAGAAETVNTGGIVYSSDGSRLIECTDKYVGSVLTVPEGVEEICDGAFLANTSLKSVVLPASLSVIGNDAFRNASVEKIDMRKCVNLRAILNASFFGCKKIKTVVLPMGIVSVGENVFGGCTSLESLTIPEILIPDSCLIGCTALKNVTVIMHESTAKTYYTGAVKNTNGKITAADARAVLRMAASLDMKLAYSMFSADVNRDGRITAADARKILRVAASLEKF